MGFAGTAAIVGNTVGKLTGGLASGITEAAGIRDANGGYNPTNPGMLSGAYDKNVGALAQQEGIFKALEGQNAFQNQSNVFQQQQALAQQLQQQAMGNGPNPALAQLNQQTGNNVAQQAALMAGQRGAGANAGLIARQAAMQGGNIQQQAVGQEAILQAQQQIAAQQQLAAQQQGMQQVAANQASNYIGTGNAYQQGQQGFMNSLYNANQGNASNQTQAEIANNQIKGQIGSAVIGGLLGGGGSAIGAMAHKGGMIGDYNQGGKVVAPPPPVDPTKAKEVQESFKKALGFADGGMTPGYHVANFFGLNMQSGGSVPGQAEVHGDSIKNDTVPAMLSPEEIVIPRHIVMSENAPELAAKFVADILAKKGMRK